MSATSATLFLTAILTVCWALTLGLTWAPCYSQLCPERYHPLATRMHIVSYYGLLASTSLALLLRPSFARCQQLSQRHLTRRELPVLRKRISVGGLVFALWVLAVVLATTASWATFLADYWTAKLAAVDWISEATQLVFSGVCAHYADMLLGLLLIPVGRNSILGRAFALHQHTLLFAHKLLAYCTVFVVLLHGFTYYSFLADWVALPWYPRSNYEAHMAFDPENPNIRLDQAKHLGYYYAVSLFTGSVTVVLMLIIVVTSLPALRRKAYNSFYYLHLAISGLVFIGASIHSSTNFYFLLPGLYLWTVDWIWRLCGGDYGLASCLDGTLEDAGNGWVRIRLPPATTRPSPDHASGKDDQATDDDKAIAQPLQTFYLNVPSVSKLQCHAFSAARTGSTNTGPVFLFQPTSREGKSQREQQKMMKREWGWKVARQASENDDAEASRVKSLRLRVEGPYCPPVHEFDTAQKIICLVGGTGVTGALSLAAWFLAHRSQDSRTSLTIIWTIRERSMALLSEWQVLLARSSAMSGGRMRLTSHVSSEYGRLNVMDAIEAELKDENEPAQSSTWIYLSGPAGLLTAAKDACCDLDAELRAARERGGPSSYNVDRISWFAARWEV